MDLNMFLGEGDGGEVDHSEDQETGGVDRNR